jgi:hypothetical protein
MSENGDGQDDEVTKWNIIFAEGEQSGSVARTCQVQGISRTTYYRKRRIKQQEGDEALRDRRHCKESKLGEAVRDAITLAALLDPTKSCKSITATISAVTQIVSASTVQRILKSEGLESKNARLKKMASIYGDTNNPLHDKLVWPPTQKEWLLELIGKINPRHRKKRQKRGTAPGRIVALDVAYVGRLRNSKIYLVVLIDTYSSFVAGTLRESSSPTAAFEFFKNTAIPALGKIGIDKIEKILTDKNAKYKNILKNLGFEAEGELEVKPEAATEEAEVEVKVEHEWIPCNQGQHIGSIDYIKRQVREGFLKEALRKNDELSLADLEVGFVDWLHGYNHGKNDGFPNYGRSPVAMIEEYLAAQVVKI